MSEMKDLSAYWRALSEDLLEGIPLDGRQLMRAVFYAGAMAAVDLAEGENESLHKQIDEAKYR